MWNPFTMIGWIKERQVRDGKRRQQKKFLYCVKDSRSLQAVLVPQRWIHVINSPDDCQPQMSCSSEDCILLAESSKLREQTSFYLSVCNDLTKSTDLRISFMKSVILQHGIWGSLQASVAPGISWALCSWTSVSILLDQGSNSWTSVSFLLHQGHCPRLSPVTHLPDDFCNLEKILILVDCFSFQNPVL